MARILPDVARGFGPIVPQRQRFMIKKQSDEDKALKIMQAISGGVGTAAQLYNVGSDIYDRYIKETPEEALRRRQEELGDAATRQMIARNVAGSGGMRGGQYDPMLGSRVPDLSGFAQARGEFARDFESLESPDYSKPVPDPGGIAMLPEPAPTLVPELAYRRDVLGETPEQIKAKPMPVEMQPDPVMVKFGNQLQKVVQAGEPGLAEHYVEKTVQAALNRGRPDLAGKFRAALEKLGGPEASAFEFIEQRGQRGLLDRPRTAAEFARGFEAGEDFAVADLNMAYRSLWNAGRQQEAEELVNLAAATMDFGQFAKSGNEPRSLILARARQAIRQGVDEGGVTGTQAVKLATSAAKRRRRRTPSGGKTRRGKRSAMTGPMTKEERANRSFVIVAARTSIDAARDILYSGKAKDRRINQETLNRRATTIEEGLTPKQLRNLVLRSGGENILLGELLPDVGKSRKTETTAKTEREKLTDSIQARQDRLSRVIGLRPSALTAEAVQSWLNENKPLSDLTETQYINTQILKYPEDRKDQAISDSALKRQGLTKAKASALYQKIKQDVNDVRVDLDRLSQEEAKLKALEAPK